jgi:ketosteroid isomerase-like protein
MQIKSWIMGLLMVMAGIVTSNAQSASDIDAIKAANQSFYTALSALDAKAMNAVWANKPYVVNIGPFSKTVSVGYEDAVSNYWVKAFGSFAKASASSTSIAQVRTDGKIAYVTGTEHANIDFKSGGATRILDNFVTNIFEKDGDRWLMVVHHAQGIPK